MSLYRIVAGNVGTEIDFTVREWPIGTAPVPGQLAPIMDVSQATALQMIITPPAGSNLAARTVTPAFKTTGTDGVLKYLTVLNDVPGPPTYTPANPLGDLWTVRVSFTVGGWSGKSEPDNFYVDP